jgi:hypothetical protein
MEFIYRRLYDALAMGGGYLRFQPPQIRRLPIRRFEPHSRQSEIAAELGDLARAFASGREAQITSTTDKDRDYYTHKCANLDRRIDLLIYELYNLSKDEIALVEDTADASDDIDEQDSSDESLGDDGDSEGSGQDQS